MLEFVPETARPVLRTNPVRACCSDGSVLWAGMVLKSEANRPCYAEVRSAATRAYVPDKRNSARQDRNQWAPVHSDAPWLGVSWKWGEPKRPPTRLEADVLDCHKRVSPSCCRWRIRPGTQNSWRESKAVKSNTENEIANRQSRRRHLRKSSGPTQATRARIPAAWS